MTAPGREGERAQECTAACFQTTAAAKRPSAPPSHEPCPTTLSAVPTVDWATAARSAAGGAGDTNRRLRAAAALHAPPSWGWPMARRSSLASPSAPEPLGLGSH